MEKSKGMAYLPVTTEDLDYDLMVSLDSIWSFTDFIWFLYIEYDGLIILIDGQDITNISQYTYTSQCHAL